MNRSLKPAGKSAASPFDQVDTRLAMASARPVPAMPVQMDEPRAHIMQILWRQRLFLLATTLLLAAIILAIVMAIPNRYAASSLVLIDPRTRNVVDSPNVVPDMTADDLMVDSEIQLLRSPALAGEIVDQLQLERFPEFGHQSDSWSLASLTGDTKGGRPYAIDRLLRGLEVERRGKSRAVRVSFTAQDPQRAADVVNALISAYMQSQVTIKREATREATAFLDQKLAQLRSEVDQRDRAAEEWRQQSGLTRGATASTNEEQVSQANAQLAVARDELAQLRAKRLAETPDTSAAVVNNLLIQNLRQRQSDIERRIAELSQEVGPRHPTMINLQNELAKLRGTIATETGKVARGSDQQERIAAVRVKELEDTVGRLRSQTGQQSVAQVKMAALDREAAASRNVLESFLKRYSETREQEALQRPDARVIAKADAPYSPAFPSRPILMMLGLGFSVLVGAGAALIRDQFRSRPLERIERIEQASGLSALAIVPALPRSGGKILPPHNRLIDEPRGDFAEAIRSVRTSLLFNSGDRSSTVVLLTSALPKEGKTVLAASIARSAALAGEDTVLVDFSLREPGVHTSLGIANEIGVTDYLDKGFDIEALVQLDPRSPLEIIPAGLDGAGANLNEAALARFFEELRARYRLIVLDTPALLPGAETRFLAYFADEAVMVARPDLPPHTLQYALRQLAEARVPTTRVLINGLDMPALQQRLIASTAA